MSITLTFSYQHLFNQERPKDIPALLNNIPSKFVIGIMATWNDTLSIKDSRRETQLFLLNAATHNFPDKLKKQVRQNAIPRIINDYELFAFPFTVEFINQELINFREDTGVYHQDYATDELNIFKAYLAIMDEVIEKQTEANQQLIEGVNEGGSNIRKLLWTHIITQFEFTNRVDPITEIFKSRALVSYLERHNKFGKPIKDFFASLGCESGQDYLNKLFGIIVPHLQRKESPHLDEYFFKIRVKEPEPVLEALVVNPKEISNDPALQIDYLGLKKKPILKFSENEYVVPYWDYMYTVIVTGLLYYLYENSAIKSLYEKNTNTAEENEKGFRKFKGTIGKDFSEGVLFQNTMTTCFTRKHEFIRFFRDDEAFNPDCYYRQGKHIFIFEFKDYLLNSEIIHSGSYERIKNAIDEKFVKEPIEKNGVVIYKDRGVFQLARNIELLASNESLFYEIDTKAASQKLKLRNMTIHPIIVQTNVHFEMPDVAEYLNEVIQERLNPITAFREIADVRMIAFKYFRSKIIMFADRKLELIDEIDNYRQVISAQKKRYQKTKELNDWFHSLTPFSFIDSAKYRKLLGYRQKDAVKFLNDCWEI